MTFERPTKNNVELGDLLVLSSANGTLSKNVCLVGIVSVEEYGVSYKREDIPQVIVLLIMNTLIEMRLFSRKMVHILLVI